MAGSSRSSARCSVRKLRHTGRARLAKAAGPRVGDVGVGDVLADLAAQPLPPDRGGRAERDPRHRRARRPATSNSRSMASRHAGPDRGQQRDPDHPRVGRRGEHRDAAAPAVPDQDDPLGPGPVQPAAQPRDVAGVVGGGRRVVRRSRAGPGCRTRTRAGPRRHGVAQRGAGRPQGRRGVGLAVQHPHGRERLRGRRRSWRHRAEPGVEPSASAGCGGLRGPSRRVTFEHVSTRSVKRVPEEHHGARDPPRSNDPSSSPTSGSPRTTSTTAAAGATAR